MRHKSSKSEWLIVYGVALEQYGVYIKNESAQH